MSEPHLGSSLVIIKIWNKIRSLSKKPYPLLSQLSQALIRTLCLPGWPKWLRYQLLSYQPSQSPVLPWTKLKCRPIFHVQSVCLWVCRSPDSTTYLTSLSSQTKSKIFYLFIIYSRKLFIDNFTSHRTSSFTHHSNLHYTPLFALIPLVSVLLWTQLFNLYFFQKSSYTHKL